MEPIFAILFMLSFIGLVLSRIANNSAPESDIGKSSCPYCSKLVLQSSLICSSCQGVLSIGSWDAIRKVIEIDPGMALRDADTLKELTVRVTALENEWLREKGEKEREQERIAAELQAADELEYQRKISEAELENQILNQMNWFARNWKRYKKTIVILVPVTIFFIVFIWVQVVSTEQRKQQACNEYVDNYPAYLLSYSGGNQDKIDLYNSCLINPQIIPTGFK